MILKKLLLPLMLMLIGASTASAALITTTGTKPAVGNGNSGSPYEIRTAEELRWFVHYENTRHWYPNDYAVLRCDIDLSSICGPDKGSWIPLGYAEESGAKDHWYGNLDGNECKITGLYIDGSDFDSSAILGFCGTVTSATIKNLVVAGDIVNAPSTAGGLVGCIKEGDCVITSCVSEVNLSTSAYNYMGGLIGYTAKASNTEITHCTSTGIINCPNGSGNNFAVGTLIGQCQGKGNINYCSSYSHPSNSQSLPMNYRLTDNTGYTDISYNIANGSYLIKIVYDCYIRLQTNYFCRGVYCDTFEKSDSEVGGNKTYTEEQFASGEACYMMNQDILFFLPLGTRSFYQNIGSDPIPYGVSFGHEVVQTAKDYTDCQNYTTIYNNTGLDTNKKHTFDAEHDHCTVCREVLNPDYATKDSEGYFLIGTKAQMLWFIELCNTSDTPNYKMKLTDDIDMEAVVQDPIHEFWGQIEGEGHVLNNVYISSNDQYVGLVGNLKLNPIPYTSPGTIRNLTMNGFVQGKAYTQYVGAFAGKVEGSESRNASLYNVRNDCQVIYNGENPGAYNNTRIGGIVGQLDGSLIYGLNNGHVYDYVNRTQETDDGIAGIAGRKTKYSKMWYVINNGEVGSAYDSYKNRGAVANNEYGGNYEQVDVGYVKDIPPTLGGFYYSNIGDYSTGASQQAETLDRIRLASGEFCLSYFRNWGQKIGVDDAPFPVINDEHPKVYNKRYYYNCTDYSNYSNVDEDGEPREHEYNDAHYCIHCYHLDQSYLAQDEDKAYLITTPAQWNTFAAVVNQAAAAGTVMSFASARLAADLSFDYETGFTALNALNGKLDGAGHKMSFTAAAAPTNVVGTTSSYGSISNLYVDFPNEDTTVRTLCGTMNGTMSGCSVKKGVPTQTANGLVSDCTGQTELSVDFKGCYKRVLIKLSDNLYRIYTGGEPEQETPYTTYTADGVCGGEVAYALSHADPEQECLWGQELGTDTWPRIICGQTPTSDTYVTRLTTYSVVNPDGKVEYLNAGIALEAAPGYYKVCQDTASWTMPPVYNFIIDRGDGTYTAEHINLDPTVQNYLPISVQAEKLTFQSADSEGKLAAKDYGFGEILSLVFPVDMPVSNVNGHVHLFDGYDALNNTLVFTSSLDDGDCTIPANTPVLVKTYGGSLLNSDLTDVTVSPMTEAGVSELENVRHLTNYQQQTLPSGKVVEDGAYVLYYVLGGDKATLTTADAHTVNQFNAYFRLPYVAGSDTQSEINVALVEDRELKTSRIVERDIFDIPYGSIDDNTEWHKVNHLSDKNVFYGNDINKDIYANISAYDFLYIHGKAGQKYYFYFNGSDATEVVIDNDGDAFIDLNDHRVGIGDVYLRGIRLAEGETVADDAFAKVYKYLEEGLVLYGYGDFSDDLKGYPFYDATGVKCGITLNLDNPNAMVVGGSNVKGVYNRIEKSENVMQGFTAEKLRLTDGGDFCYDYSVKCPDVTFTRYDIPEGVRYVTFVLPFAVNYVKGMHEYIDCDGKNVYFNTPEDGVIDAYLPIVIDMQEYEGNTITITGENFVALSPNGTFNVAPSPSSKYDLKYGFVTKRQESTPLTHEELVDYNVYCFSLKSYKFVRAVNTFSISPFRAFFMLPKAARTRGDADTEAEIEALDIVLDGEEITTGVVDVDFDVDVDLQSKRFNMLGQPVNSNYRGIVIQGGKKIVIK